MLTLMVCSMLAMEVPTGAEMPSADSSTYEFTFDPAGAQETNLALAADEPVSRRFGEAGSMYWLVNLGGASTLTSDHFVRAGAAVSYFMADDFSIDLGLNLSCFWI